MKTEMKTAEDADEILNRILGCFNNWLLGFSF
jgi:hypothetical protein